MCEHMCALCGDVCAHTFVYEGARVSLCEGGCVHTRVYVWAYLCEGVCGYMYRRVKQGECRHTGVCPGVHT